MIPAEPAPSAPEVIIDTNSVLDWMLFEDAAGLAVGAEVAAGRLRWVASAAMLDELVAVLSRPGLERWSHRLDGVLEGIARHCLIVTAKAIGASQALTCSDPDDQKFIDLALARRVAWLVTRDKALLRLAKRAARQGVEVLTPMAWARSRSIGNP